MNKKSKELRNENISSIVKKCSNSRISIMVLCPKCNMFSPFCLLYKDFCTIGLINKHDCFSKNPEARHLK